MKSLIACLVAILCFGVAIAAPTALEQQKYTVQSGDNLWNLAGAKLEDPRLWKELVESNPFLKQPGRVFERNGKTIVILKPGESLVGLEKLGIIPAIESSASTVANPVVVESFIPSWLWWLVAILALLILAAYLIRQMLQKDAATARPAVVPGGVPTTEAARLRFQESAARQHAATTGMQVPVQQFVIIEQTAGRIFGVLNVRYADGMEVPRRLNGECAFRAVVRFPDGHAETLYMLQACGNDLRYGGISKYLPGPEFRFVPDETVRSATPAAPAVAATPAVAPVATPAVPATSVVVAVNAPVERKDEPISFEFTRGDAKNPNSMVRVKNGSPAFFSFAPDADGTMTFRFRQ